VTLKLQALYPLPNIPGRPDGGSNYSVNTLQADAYNNTLGRMDYNANDRKKPSDPLTVSVWACDS
jgi:hypothetical protein